MRTKHEPTEAFIERLESTLASEVRRRNERAASVWWIPRSPARLAAALAAIVLVSMAAGGAAVDAAYRAQNNERRGLIASLYQQRLDIAKQALALARTELDAARRRESMGAGSRGELLDSQLKHAQAETTVRVAELQLEEVSLSGVEPVFHLSAPLIRGRDFVTPRLAAELESAREAMRVAEVLLQDASRRVEIGIATPADREVKRARSIDTRSAAQLLERKLQIRSQFLRGTHDAIHTDLLGLEAEAVERITALSPNLDLTRREVTLTESRIQKGLAGEVELAQAKLKLMTLESELAKAELELALIKQKLNAKAASPGK